MAAFLAQNGQNLYIQNMIFCSCKILISRAAPERGRYFILKGGYSGFVFAPYRLEKLARLYFPDDLVSAQYAKEDDSTHEYEKLMKPSSYTGRVERRKGAITQPHRPVIK